MSNKIFLLYNCDAEKGIESDSLLLVTSSFKRISEVIILSILNERMSYFNEKMETVEQVRMFIDDYVENNIDLIDERLIYGYCYEVNDGEIIIRP